MQILAVVVLYKIRPEDSTTLRSLIAELERDPDQRTEIAVLVWDNSPEPLVPNKLTGSFEYFHSIENKGVSGAYNSALERAESLGIPWLLLLDQDTTLPQGFVRRMLDYSRSLYGNAEIATVIPFVRSNEVLVSPRTCGHTLRSSQIDESESGIIRKKSFAINSGTLMRVSALRGIGGYSDLFWLDLSDQFVFHRLYKAGKLMYLAGDLEIAHSIANSDYDRGMSRERYKSYLAAENLFSQTFHSRVSNWAHNAVLLARALRQYRRFREKGYAYLTLQSLWQRLVLPNRRGIKLWTQNLRQRNIPGVEHHDRIA